MTKDKIKNLDLSNTDANLYWYTSVYLGLPSIFTAVIRNRVINNNTIKEVIIPVDKVQDPISGAKINTYPMDRYFFIGSDKLIHSESELGFKSSLTTTTLIRNSKGSPIKVKLHEIQQMLEHHKNQKRRTLQEMVDVVITNGTFKDWYGTVQKSPEKDTVHISINSDSYNFDIDVPMAICKPVTYTS